MVLGPRYRLLPAVCLAVVACGIGAAQADQNLGPIPDHPSSRCAPVHVSPHVVKLGGLIHATAGPATAACGGPASTVTWDWEQLVDSVEEAHDCPATTAGCTFKARFPTGKYVLFCISGSSPAGGWDSCDYYAVLGTGYVGIRGVVMTKANKPVVGATLRLTGGRRATTRTDANGEYLFAVKPKGRYVVSLTVAGRRHSKTIKGKRALTQAVDFTV